MRVKAFSTGFVAAGALMVSAATTYFVLDGDWLQRDFPVPPEQVVVIPSGGETRLDRFTFTPGPSTIGFFAGKGGHADALERELLTRLHASTNRCVLIGHSLGGLFVLEFRRRNPTVPCGIMAFDPSLWWAPEDWRTPLVTNDLFVAFGTKPQRSRLSELQAPLVTQFVARYPDRVRCYPEATHATIFKTAIRDGLSALVRP